MAKKQQYAAEIKFGGSIEASLRASVDTWQQQFEQIGAAGKQFEQQMRAIERQMGRTAKDSSAFGKLEKDLEEATSGARRAAAAQQFLVGKYALHKREAREAAEAEERLTAEAKQAAAAQERLAEEAKKTAEKLGAKLAREAERAADKQERLADAFRHAAAEQFLGTMDGIVDRLFDAGRGMAELMMRTSEWGVAVGRTAQTVGATPATVQRLQQAFAAAGVDAETTNDALVDISERIGEGASDRQSTPAQALRRLGLDPEQLNRQSADSQVEELIRATQGLTAGESNFVLRDILGDEAARALLALRTEGADAFRGRVDNAVTVDTASLERFSRMMTTLMTNAQLLAAEFFGPIAAAFSDTLGDGQLDMAELARHARSLGESAAEWVPPLVEAGKAIFEMLGGLEGTVETVAAIGAGAGVVAFGAKIWSVVTAVQALRAAWVASRAAAAAATAAQVGTAAASAGSAAAGAGGLVAQSGRLAAAFGLLLGPVGLLAAGIGAAVAAFTLEGPEGDTLAEGMGSFWGDVFSGETDLFGELGDAIDHVTGADDVPASVRDGAAAARQAAGDSAPSSTTTSTDNRQYNINVAVDAAGADPDETGRRTVDRLRGAVQGGL